MARSKVGTPGAGELDCLAVLWQAQEDGRPALRLREIRDRVAKRRARLGEADPALTTISTHLRSLVAKGLLTEVVVRDTAQGTHTPKTRGRGMLSPATRSPYTGYHAAFEP